MYAGIIGQNRPYINILGPFTRMKSSNPVSIVTIQPPNSFRKPLFNSLPVTHEVVPKTGQQIKKSGSVNLAITTSPKHSVKSTNGVPVSPRKSDSMKTRYTHSKDNVSTKSSRVHYCPFSPRTPRPLAKERSYQIQSNLDQMTHRPQPEQSTAATHLSQKRNLHRPHHHLNPSITGPWNHSHPISHSQCHITNHPVFLHHSNIDPFRRRDIMFPRDNRRHRLHHL
jgi:hypothetical protein